METVDVEKSGRRSREVRVGQQPGAGWREALRQRAGKAVLSMCPKGRGGCAKDKCSLQPLCACAREDLAQDHQQESRFWLMLAGCALVVLIAAFHYVMKR